MKNLAFILALVVMSTMTFAQKLTLDSYHAQLKFEVTHLTISHVSGEFKKFDVKLDYTKPDFSDAKFVLTSEVNSIDTGVEMRDNHLKSADFFDVEKFPTLNFSSTSIAKGKNNEYTLKGNLTIHGVTKPVTLKLKYNGNTTNPMSKKQTYGFTVTGSFKRSDFGIGAKFPEAVISDEVRINSNMEFTAG